MGRPRSEEEYVGLKGELLAAILQRLESRQVEFEFKIMKIENQIKYLQYPRGLNPRAKGGRWAKPDADSHHQGLNITARTDRGE